MLPPTQREADERISRYLDRLTGAAADAKPAIFAWPRWR